MKTEYQPQLRSDGSPVMLSNGVIACDLKSLPRCQAKAKGTGNRCGNPAMTGKRVCYIHGGKSPGAPKGNKNALKHGEYTEETKTVKQTIALVNKLSRRYANEF
jgi:uncharacterized protein YjcR